ncbi:MAG: 4-hydroxy-tetrahydrodipicolinate reductase [Chloroflexi bacterium]|nr:4-hydroxy-tetrahydrodipicolinate reductase [Chloroflexota bacterium]
MDKIKILVFGALGKMGKEVINAACNDKNIQVVAAVDKNADAKTINLPDGSGIIPISNDLEQMIAICLPDVVVDFSGHDAVMQAVRTCVKNKVRMVIGTTGLTQEELNEMQILAGKNKIGIVYASNFSLGAVLMMHMAKIAARYFDYSEIIELHHEKKADAPSGTAVTTAKEMIKSRGKPFTYPQTLKETYYILKQF